MKQPLMEAGIPEAQFAWFVEGRPHETEKVANRQARAAIIQTAPVGPTFTLPLERYDGLIEAQIHLPETYTSTGFERCGRCIRERATRAEEIVVKAVVTLSDIIENPVYLQAVEESVRHALAGKRGYEDFTRCIGQKRLKLALRNPHLLGEIGSHEELLDVLITATQQRREQEWSR